jgi:D-alanyl-D-alanine carboxypeptidase/D-alanyl-D-alanine-endopeptidase (penicillin-binding protein 4)
LVAASVAGQLPPPEPAPAQKVGVTGESELALRIETIIHQPDVDRALWGMEVYSPARNQTLYAVNADRFFTPASVAKLFTTTAALALLGPDYRFRTAAGGRARIASGGRLAGNLYLVGGGDPDLAGCDLPYVPLPEPKPCDPAPALDDLAAQIAARGVTVVSGDLVVDQSYFSPEPYPIEWAVGDLVWSYAAPVRALSLADNTVTLRITPGEEAGTRAVVTREPFTRFYDIQNEAWTAPPGTPTQLTVRRDPGSRVVELRGPIALDDKGQTLRLAVEEPSEFAGELFLQALARRGIRIEGRLDVRYAPGPPSATLGPGNLPVLLAERVSRPLADDVTFINKTSQNLHSEMLLRALGRLQPPVPAASEPAPAPLPLRPLSVLPPRIADGSTEAGLEAMGAWLAGAGLNPDDVELTDGSGVARRNLVTPHATVQLLAYALGQPWGGFLRESLPVAGADGTLKERMNGTPAEGRVRAKTGSIGETNALAGYVETRGGETLVFAVFLNHHTLGERRALALLDQIAIVLAELPQDETRNSKIENREPKP